MLISKFTVNKFIAGVANFLTTVLSPLLMPTFGVFLVFWLSVLCLLPYGRRVSILLVCMGITCILPLIFLSVMRHFKLVTDLLAEVREQRTVPYLFDAVCNAAAAYYLYYSHMPRWFIMFMVGSMVTIIVMVIINMRWKISAHMAGIGGVVALINQIHVQGLGALDLLWPLCISIIVAGALGSARLILKRHDLWQVLAGVVVGFLCVTITMKLFG